jgi:hypothetical protein
MRYPMHITAGFALQVARGHGPLKPADLFGSQPLAPIIAKLETVPPDALMPCSHSDCAHAAEHANLDD